ncbi:unnamed protein product, partial [Ilex paraguariensis]
GHEMRKEGGMSTVASVDSDGLLKFLGSDLHRWSLNSISDNVPRTMIVQAIKEKRWEE